MNHKLANGRALLLLAVFLGGVSLQATPVADLNLIQTGAVAWYYAAANDDSSKDPVFLSIARDGRDGAVSLSAGKSLDGLTEQGRYTFDPLGRLLATRGADDSVLECSYRQGTVSVTARTKGGDLHKDIRTDVPVLDFGALMFFAGAFRLAKAGDEQPFKAIVVSEKGLADYDVYVRLVGEESLSVAGTNFRAQRMELGASGLLGLVVPKMQVWVDADSRLPLRVEAKGKKVIELLRVGS